MLCWVCAPTSNAQAPQPGLRSARYRLISQGEPAPFTGVITELETYRTETAKFKIQASLLSSQVNTIEGLKAQLSTSQSEAAKCAAAAELQAKILASCQETKNTLNQSLATTQKAYEVVKPRFYESPFFWAPIAFVVGTFTGAKIVLWVKK